MRTRTNRSSKIKCNNLNKTISAVAEVSEGIPLPEGNVLDFGNDVGELDGLIEQDGMINEFLAHLSVHLASSV